MYEDEKIIAGLSLGFNSSAALLGTKSGVLGCLSQERTLNGVKNTKELPIEALVMLCDKCKVDRIDRVAFTHYEEFSLEYVEKSHDGKPNLPAKYSSIWHSWKSQRFPVIEDGEMTTSVATNFFGEFLYKCLESEGIKLMDPQPVRVEHHVAHEWSCYPMYPKFQDYAVCTSDGFGDGYSGRISIHHKNFFKVLSQVRLVDSPAMVYQYFTGAMGFKEHQHEGKVTGLAAHGKNEDGWLDVLELLTGSRKLRKPSELPPPGRAVSEYEWSSSGYDVDLSRLRELDDLELDAVRRSKIKDFDHMLRLRKTIYAYVKDLLGPDYRKDDILGYMNGTTMIPKTMKVTPWECAKMVQDFAEKVTLNWLKILRNCNMPLYLAGGLFANVKLNERVKDTKWFETVMVAPPMGDEGGALGSAAVICYELEHDWFVRAKRLGPEVIICGGTDPYDNVDVENPKKDDKSRLDEKIVKAVRAGKIKEPYVFGAETFEQAKADLVAFVARQLANNQIVHWVQGRNEFGPRALANRTTYYTARDENGTKVLNHAMGRSEYMPYCPICLERNMPKLFWRYESCKDALRYMTMCVDAKAEAKREYKGAIHVDGTARPQIIYHNEPWTEWSEAILEKYEELTGYKMLINTSYNTHGLATANLAEDCWDTWERADFVGAALIIDGQVFEAIH
jgi:carbamoyltransferase